MNATKEETCEDYEGNCGSPLFGSPQHKKKEDKFFDTQNHDMMGLTKVDNEQKSK